MDIDGSMSFVIINTQRKNSGQYKGIGWERERKREREKWERGW
jgi:hypothetical protein